MRPEDETAWFARVAAALDDEGRRPLRHPQVIGSVAVVWDDLLPALPDDVRDANARAVVAELVRRHGGEPLGVARS